MVAAPCSSEQASADAARSASSQDSHVYGIFPLSSDDSIVGRVLPVAGSALVRAGSAAGGRPEQRSSRSGFGKGAAGRQCRQEPGDGRSPVHRYGGRQAGAAVCHRHHCPRLAYLLDYPADQRRGQSDGNEDRRQTAGGSSPGGAVPTDRGARAKKGARRLRRSGDRTARRHGHVVRADRPGRRRRSGDAENSRNDLLRRLRRSAVACRRRTWPLRRRWGEA